MGLVAIVEIGRAVSDFVSHVDKLCLQRRTKFEQVFSQLWMLPSLIIMRVFDDALANFECKVESAKGCIAQLEVFHDAQRVQVVIEKISVLAHRNVERFFSGMPEWGMTHIVHQRQSLDQIHVQAKLSRDGSRNLRNFNRVSQPITKVVGMAASENLSFCLKPAKGPGVNNAVAVTLKIVAIRMRRLGITASAGLLHPHRVVGEHAESLTESTFSN